MTQSTRVFHRVLSMDGTGYDMAPDGTPIRTLTRTPTGGNLATCPRSLASGPGTLRERLARLDRSNRDAAVKIALLRADNTRLSATIAAARKNTRTIPPRVSTTAARKSAAVLAEPPRVRVTPMGITADPDYIPTPTAPPRRMRIGPFGIYEEND